MENENTSNTNATATVASTNVSPETNTIVATATVVKATRKSWKGKWGKVGARPKDVKWPRGAFTVLQLVALNPDVCELTLRNRVIDSARGYKIVNKMVDGKKVKTKVSIPQTLVRMEKNATRESVGRPSFRYMSKAAFEANQKNAARNRTPKNIVAPSPTQVAVETA